MWMKDMFGVDKPIIALLHLRALPGDPLYQRGGSIEQVTETARKELLALQKGGVDGVLIANEFSLPYEKKVSPVAVAAMGYIVGALREDIKIPFGVNIVLNPLATIDLAAAVGASFVRSTFTGAYIGEDGLTDTDISVVTRRKNALGLDNLKLLYKVNPESGVYLAERPIEKITKSMIFREVAGDTPVLCNTGCTAENICEKLDYCDGACVGTAFKKDGKFQNLVETDRVKLFMDRVRQYRNKHR